MLNKLLLSVLLILLYSCGGRSANGDSLISINKFKVSRVVITGSSNINSTTTAEGIADTDADAKEFEVELKLDGVELKEDFGNGSKVENIISINSINDSSATDVENFNINFTLNP